MKLIKSFEQIQKENKPAEFYALGSNGKKYNASYSTEHSCMFFCIPSTVRVVGYITKD